MKKILIFIMVITAIFTLGSCGNRQILDTTYSFERAILTLPDGELIEGEVESWKDYEGDQIQVVIDGKTYLVHSSDVVLISE